MNDQTSTRQTDEPDTSAAERAARMTWSHLAEPTDIRAYDFVSYHGAITALMHVRAGHGAPRWRERLNDLNPDRDQPLDNVPGTGVLIPGDTEWPTALDALGPRTPFCLWVRGPVDVAAATWRAVTITGSRASTPYGEHVAAELAAGAAERRITVVAGAAYGIEAAAHRATLGAGGTTIAVLACGIDHVYPRDHEDLIRSIGDTGILLSEIPPGQPPTRARSDARGQLMAALSTATVVVEAGQRSPSLRVASRAAGLGRRVGGVPGPVTSLNSTGPHRLLRGGATCVTSAADLATLVSSASDPAVSRT